MQRLALCVLLAVCLAGPAAAQKSFPSFAAALNQPAFSSLKTVVNTLGLTGTLSNAQLKVTVFVPNNNAFAAAQKATGMSTAQLTSLKSVMQQVVYYHIVKEVVRAPLPNKQLQTFVSGKSLQGAGNKVKDAIGQTANIIDPNVKCGAGIAHGVDKVLLFMNMPSSGR
ncbi:MAG: hypothetical protein J3K34DRAFT_404922 [Monoraphidium minutum]|nr:MAG: hypothetical protein J3K34DRAFT_404922 [Monoraphidium minutum]